MSNTRSVIPAKAGIQSCDKRRPTSRRLFFPNTYRNDPMTFRAVLSPCIGICSLDDRGLCSGCRRTTAEIARWGQMSDDERLRIMEIVLPTRDGPMREPRDPQ